MAHPRVPGTSIQIQVICLPSFNAFATMAFLDPLRIANYLNGDQIFRWSLLAPSSTQQQASSRVTIVTEPLQQAHFDEADWVIVSSSWTPEAFGNTTLLRQLRVAAARGLFIAGIDTGGFILADAGLLKGRSATVHYEHIDAFAEKYPDIDVVEDLFVLTKNLGTCCGGIACSDFAFHLLNEVAGPDLSNAVARYMFHGRVRSGGVGQHPGSGEPAGFDVPALLKQAITIMERNLENPLPVSEIARKLDTSQRTLERLFKSHTRRSPVRYYADARLDRARGLVTQTTMAITEIAFASGFPSPEGFSRAYRRRFGLAPREDRINGRVPFEFRAWPMHSVIKSRTPEA